MQAKDFLVCTFKGDDTTYVAEISNVFPDSFQCNFVHSGKMYVFSTGNWSVTQSDGGFPKGTPLTSHKIYTNNGAALSLHGFACVTFNNAKRFLGILNSIDPQTVAFLHPGTPTYTFQNNKIISNGGYYPAGQPIRGIEAYSLVAESTQTTPDATPANDVETDPKKVNEYNPASEDTIVVNTVEFESGISDFHNYRGWKTNSAIPHNKVPKKVRLWSAIKHIALHETSADSGDGFQPPYTAHFSVLKDGKILQFNDLAEIEYHIGIFNDVAVGIEFVNRDWEDGRGVKQNNIPDNLSEENGYLHAFWGSGYNIYKLPEIDQLERLVELLERLLQKLDVGFPSVERAWLQLVSYNQIKDMWDFVDAADIPDSDNGKELQKYFIYSNGYSYMVPARFKSFETGVISHSSVSNVISINAGGVNKEVVDENAHSDGSFLSLYSWLRITKFLTKDEAFDKAKELFKNNLVKARTKKAFEGYTYDNNTKAWKLYSAAQKRDIYLLDIEDAI